MTVVTPLPTDALTVLAKHMVNGRATSLSTVDIAEAIIDVTHETQIVAASTIVMTVMDPDWVIQNDGLITVDDNGVLAPLEVNFPEGSDSWWRLVMVDGSTDLTQPNLTLTFEDRIIAELRSHFGPKTVKPGTRTRAQFVHQLVNEVKANGGIRFVCPSENVVQPIAGSKAKRSSVNKAKTDQTNKARAVHPSAAVTAKGQPLDASQIDEVNALLAEAAKLKAGPVATEALICAGIGESWLGRAPGSFQPNVAGYWGVLQGGSGQKGAALNFPDPHDTTGQAHSFLLGGRGFQAGGAIALSRTVSDPGEIATRVEASGEAGSFYGQYRPEAKAIIAAYGGIAAGSQGGNAKPVSDVGQLQRGTTGDPHEDSWQCITRLAQEVNWFAFSNADTLYYMDGPDLIGQRPALYLDRDSDSDSARVAHLNYTVDNTAYAHQKVKGRMILKPQTPSQVTLSLICDVQEFRAGDVFVLRNYGAADGRWIVQDATRRCFSDTFTQFTLVPPTAPFPEPTATTKTTASGPATGTASSAADAALRAVAEKGKYVYRETRPMPKSLFGAAPRIMDCSAFVTLCYKAAKLPDPNGLGYNGQGFTGTLFANCKQVTSPQPGDLCFYGNLTFLHRGLAQVPTHVTIFVGDGQVVSMGSQGDPSKGAATVMKAATDSLLGYYRPKG